MLNALFMNKSDMLLEYLIGEDYVMHDNVIYLSSITKKYASLIAKVVL